MKYYKIAMKFVCKGCKVEKPVWLKTGLCVDCSVPVEKIIHEKFKHLDENGEYIVRLWDGFDNLWIDIFKPVSKQEAITIWLEKTKNGTMNVEFSDIDYYHIFPIETKMLYS